MSLMCFQKAWTTIGTLWHRYQFLEAQTVLVS